MIRLKLNRNTTVQLAWVVMIIYTFAIGRSDLKYIFPISMVKRLCTYCSMLLLIAKICFFSKFSKTKIIYILFLFVLIMAVTFSSKNMSLPVYFLFIVASTDIDFRELVRVDIKTKAFIVILLFVLGLLGVVSFFSWEINGAVKFSFGWGHPNTFCGIVVIIIMEWLYLKWDRLTLKHYTVTLLVLLFLYTFAASRTTIYTALFVIGWVVLSKRNNVLVNNRLAQFFCRYVVCITTGLSWGAVALYQSGAELGRRLNSMLTTRLAWSAKYLLRYGVSLWGSDIDTVSSRQARITGESIQILDMAYIRIFIENGLVYAVFFIIAFCIIGKYLIENNKKPELMLLLFFAIIGIGSYASANLFSNYMLLLFIPSAFSRKNNKMIRNKNTFASS